MPARIEVVVHEGLVLDGQNRLRACELAGVEPSYVEWNGVGSPVDPPEDEIATRWILTSCMGRWGCAALLGLAGTCEILRTTSRPSMTCAKAVAFPSKSGRGARRIAKMLPFDGGRPAAIKITVPATIFAFVRSCGMRKPGPP